MIRAIILFLFLFNLTRSSEVPVFGYHLREGVPKATELKRTEGWSRIVGGTQVGTADAVPYQAGIIATLTSGWNSLCGGALVSNTRVLTAAHCWWDGQSQARLFTVVLGSLTIFTGGTRRETSDVTAHPNWAPSTYRNDIAVVRIESVSFSNTIQIIPLPGIADVNTDFAGLSGLVTGYGKTSDGKPHRNIGIIPGAARKDGSIQYMAEYKYANDVEGLSASISCGAVIIHKQFLLTAAHCVVIRSTYDVGIQKKIFVRNAVRAIPQDITKTIIYPEFFASLFKRSDVENDIAIIQVGKDLDWKPIAIADASLRLNSGDILTTMGYGETDTTRYARHLNVVNITYVDRATCQKIYQDYINYDISEKLFCAGSFDYTSCKGDDGGPVVYNGTLVGLSSWGSPFCGRPRTPHENKPTLYTYVASYRSFIDDVIASDFVERKN